MKKYFLLSLPGCKPCDYVKKWIAKNELNIEIDYVNLFGTMPEATKYNVMKTPTLIIDDGENYETIQPSSEIIEYLKNYTL